MKVSTPGVTVNTMSQILFYSPKEVPYGCFSNFSRHSVLYQGRNWSTSEAAFQAMKFYPHRLDLVEAIRHAPTPTEAARIGRDRSFPIRDDWDNLTTEMESAIVDDGRGPVRVIERVKDLIMYEVVLAKFSQYSGIQSILLGTGTLPLVENALHDPYWGIGCSGTGVNKLGKILMYTREVLKIQVK
jgi:N-glycosidase YbiA